MQFEQFGRYLLLHKIGVGGMAEIFLAKQIGMAGFEKLVVIKRILPEHVGNPSYVKMFLDEARLAAAMSHPNVAQVFDLAQTGNTIYIAMEYIAGQDLAHVLRVCKKTKTTLPYPLVARILADACDGLHYAHTLKDSHGARLNVIHRDVSPGNLVVSYDGTNKVLDFGVAKSDSHLSKTYAGTLKGKFGYMAPEQVEMKVLDARVDVWALGVVLWEALAVRRLFAGTNELGLAKAIVDDPIPPPTTVVPDIPPALVAIVMRALERDRNRRYANALEMRNDLDAYVRALGVPATALEVAAFIRQIFAAEYAAHEKLLAGIPNATPEQLAGLVEIAEQGSFTTFSGASEGKPYLGRGSKKRLAAIAAGAAAAVVVTVGLGWGLLRPNADAQARPTGTLHVVTEPAGANIYLDGARQVPSPVTIPGVAAEVEHVLIADLDGFELSTQRVQVAAAATGDITIALVRKTAAAAPGSVKIAVSSTPSGARVVRTDSGEVLGVTPLEKIVPASASQVVFRLELAGYEKTERTVTLKADTALEVALPRSRTGGSKVTGGKNKKKKMELTTDGVVDPFAQ